MTRRILTLLLMAFVIAAVPAWAQKNEKKGGHKFREMLEFKIKYLSQEMELKGDQQSKFVTLYTQMSNEIHEAMASAGKLKRKVEKDKNATDADYQRASQALSDAQAKVGQIEKKYQEKFKTFLSQKQLFKMKEAEEKYRAKLYEMRQESKKGK